MESKSHASLAGAPRDDRIFPGTRRVAWAIVPILAAAFLLLYLQPDHTAELFAWRIKPRMTPLLMGAGYGCTADFFLRAAVVRRLHPAEVWFLPVTPLPS